MKLVFITVVISSALIGGLGGYLFGYLSLAITAPFACLVGVLLGMVD